MYVKVGSWNVLLDDYMARFGDYSHVAPYLRDAGARLPFILKTIAELNADVLGLQEADETLKNALRDTGKWQVVWTKKSDDSADGCLMLVRLGLEITAVARQPYGDGSGHMMQRVTVDGKLTIGNTHIKWDKRNHRPHAGVVQAAEFIAWMNQVPGPKIMLGDCNFEPGELPRDMIEAAGYVNAHGGTPTARVNGARKALDLVAGFGVLVTPLDIMTVGSIPNETCPSDHVPVLAQVRLR